MTRTFIAPALPRLLVILLSGLMTLTLPTTSAQDPVDPSDVYLQAYLLFQDAAKMETDGQLKTALEKYQKASDLFDSVVRAYPSWNPQMITYRRQKVLDSIRRLESGAAGAPMAPPHTSLELPTNPLPPVAPIRPLTPTPSPPPVADNNGSLGGEIDRRMKQYESDIIQLRAENHRLSSEREQNNRLYQQQLEELNRLKTNERTLQMQISEAQQRIAGAGKANAEEISTLQGEVIILRRQLEKASGAFTEANSKTNEVLAELNGAKKEIASLEKDKQSILGERDQMAALLSSYEKGSDEALKKLMADNRRLQSELKLSLGTIETLEGDNEQKDSEIAKLHDQVKEVRSEIAALQEERNSYEERIASLKSQLKETNQLLAGTDAATLDEAVRAENAILRTVIQRQLRQQARMQGHRELIAEELAKLDGNSTDLLASVEEITGSKLLVSEEEKSLFRGPSGTDITGGIHAQMLVERDPNELPSGQAPDANLKGKELLQKASEFVQAQDLPTAENFYQRYLETDSPTRAIYANLGIIKLRMGKFAEAEKALRSSLEFDQSNPRSHYLLGVNYFWQGKDEEASRALRSTAQLDPTNSRARHYLGVISARGGDLQTAREQFVEAVEIDPSYAPAHFNLAVIYATKKTPSIDKARSHYQKALELGAEPDQQMENLLGKEVAGR